MPVLEDMEEIRKSPAGMLIRLEDKVEALEIKMDQRFKALESSMDHQLATIKWAIALLFPFILGILGKLFLMK